MPNLMLTNWCNYKCPYCFGVDFMYPKVEARNMSCDTFSGIIRWLEKTPEHKVVHLMGGEPTLHPEFEWIVNELLSRDFHITVFSNLATEQSVGYAEKLADLPVEWVVNINPPKIWNRVQRERILSSLSLLGQRASITFNIMPNEETDYWALDLIKTYHLAKVIKVGFILPTLTSSNYSLAENEYGIVADKVVKLALEAEKGNVILEYECGIPTCSFTDQQLGILWETGSELFSGCYSRLDITPLGECIYCLPLATLAAVPYSNFETYDAAKDWFERKLGPYRHLGRTLNCATCNLMNASQCNGGCLAKILMGANNIKIQ